jgi:hypothetical protein
MPACFNEKPISFGEGMAMLGVKEKSYPQSVDAQRWL